MSDDFATVRDTFADSLAGRMLARSRLFVASAWATSITGRVSRSAEADVASLPVASRVATIAAAIAIASAMQVALSFVMPATVAPALARPAFVLVTVFATAVASRPMAFIDAWRQSRVAGWLTRPR